MSTADIITTAGISLILLAFFLLTIKKVSQQSTTYNLMNLAGGVLAGIGAYLIGSMPFLILEGIWSVVALYALIKK